MPNLLGIYLRSPLWLKRYMKRVSEGQGIVGKIWDAIKFRGTSDEPIEKPEILPEKTHVLIGPVNTSAQGYEWARTIERHVENVQAVAVTAFDTGNFQVRTDLRVPSFMHFGSRVWQRDFERYAKQFSHVLIESALPLFGRLHQMDSFVEARLLADAGLQVGYIFHGSELRVPSEHRAQEPWSPLVPNNGLAIDMLEESSRRLIQNLREFDYPSFVSTPDLLDYLPSARWCPVVVDTEMWSNDRIALKRQIPLVIHTPTNVNMKGSDLIEPVVQRLADEGLIEYRQITGLRHSEIPRVYRDADIVLDQFRIGSYGVAACEAMAAGALVIGHVSEKVRSRVLDETGLRLPIVQATPDLIEDALRSVLENRSEAQITATQGMDFVAQVHDGMKSAEALRAFLS